MQLHVIPVVMNPEDSNYNIPAPTPGILQRGDPTPEVVELTSPKTASMVTAITPFQG